MELNEAKQRAKATWAAGDYDGIADYVWSVGGDVLGRVGVTADGSAACSRRTTSALRT